MNTKEINDLAAWTAKSIADTIKEAGRTIDDAGTDIIREYVKACLIDWQHGGKASLENCAQLVTEIFQRRKSETATELEVFNAMMILGAKFPAFVAENQRERDAESAKFAAAMPAVKAD